MTSLTNGQSELTKDVIIDAIRPVKDPEIGRGLVELGMVPNVDIDGRNIRVHIELTTPACPLRGKIEEDVRQALTTVPELGEVELVWTSRVRASGSGKSDAEPIKGVKNTIAVASGKGGVGKSTVP